MAEELRFFLRIALYVVAASIAYWIMAKEHAGTVLFLFLAAGCFFFVGAIAHLLRQTHSEIRVDDAQRLHKNRTLDMIDRVIGFEEHPGDASGGPMTLQEQAVPTASVWPIVGAVCVFLFVMGLLFGAWLWVPAILLGLYVARGWLTQLSR